MTTETPGSSTRHRGSRALVGAALAAVAVGLSLAVIGALAGGSPAAYGALAGTGFVVAVFGLGTAAVHVVAQALPEASLLVALLTYTLQIVLMALVFVALQGSGLLDETLDRAWFGFAVIAGAACWLIGQIALATRARIPAYDLTDTGGDDGPT
jgi:hypothetical protein